MTLLIIPFIIKTNVTEEIRPKCVQSHRVERISLGLGVQPFSVWDTHLTEQTKAEIQAGCACTCFCFGEMFETGGTSDLGFWSTWLYLYFGARTCLPERNTFTFCVCLCGLCVCACMHMEARGGFQVFLCHIRFETRALIKPRAHQFG